jgi:hypothetical protein
MFTLYLDIFGTIIKGESFDNELDAIAQLERDLAYAQSFEPSIIGYVEQN